MLRCESPSRRLWVALVAAVATALLTLVLGGSAEANEDAVVDPINPDEVIDVTTVIVTTRSGIEDSLQGVLDRADLDDASDADTEQVDDGAAPGDHELEAGTVQRVLENLDTFVATVDDKELAALRRDPDIVSIEFDELSAPTLVSSVPHIDADVLHEIGVDGAGVTGGGPTPIIAIMDTGVDQSHPTFGGRVVAGACFARGADNTTGAGDCPDGTSDQLGIAAAVHCSFGPACDHGTHVAGIASGADSTYTGVAPGSDLISIQVFSNFSGTPLSWKSDQLAGLDWLVGQVEAGLPVAAVNMSLGGGRYESAAACDASNPARKIAADRLNELGVAVIASAGNNGWSDAMAAPACVSSVLSVGATTLSDGVACYSNSDVGLDFWAPGGGFCAGEGAPITSSVPGGGVGAKFGTSMAAPHLAGAVALLRQCSIAPDQPETLAALTESGLPISRSGVVAPRIDVDGAARLLVGNDDVASATPLAIGLGATIDEAGNNACASIEQGENGNASVWFRVTPSSAGSLIASTASAPNQQTFFDTELALYKGPSTASTIAELEQLRFDDDGGPGTSSRIVTALNGGDSYFIRVTSKDVERGLFNLRLVMVPITCAGQVVTHVADTTAPLVLGPTDDVVLGNEADNVVNLGSGDDLMCAGGGVDLVLGGAGNDRIWGGDGDDDLWGGTGDDVVVGNSGNDILGGEAGIDQLYANDGNDIVRGGGGGDRIVGGSGDDLLYGGDGDDSISGGSGNDLLEGQAGLDVMSGQLGDDRLYGGSEDDLVMGGNGHDVLYGHQGSDRLKGGNGDDVLWGGADDDTLHAGTGNDVLRGSSGDDVLRGGVGADDMSGGPGHDDCDGGWDTDNDVASGCEIAIRVP